MIKFNNDVKLILADVDETIADVYVKATPEMIVELDKLLDEGKILFLVSGGGLQSIRERIVDLLKPENRHRVIVAHCSGAEVWGFEKGGEIKSHPYYGVYEDHFTDDQKKKWRDIVNVIIEKYHLKIYPTQPTASFIEKSMGDPLSVMYVDRGPQITFEFVNSTNLTPDQKGKIETELGIEIPQNHGTYDLRYPVLAQAEQLYKEAGLHIKPKLAGTMALDNVIEGVDKTRAVKYVLDNKEILADFGLNREDMRDDQEIEIWGDKYSQKKGGPDFQMCLAVSPKVRAIDFRDESVDGLPEGYNIVIWDGDRRLQGGLLQYLESRHQNDD